MEARVKMEMGNFVLQLPVEITTDIFSRLPVDSVKLVCKAWRSLVEDPVFLDTHTHRLLLEPAAAAVTTNTESFHLTVRPLQENRQKHHFLECNNHEMSNTSSSSCCFKLSKPLNAMDDNDHWYIIGSSNGLICSYGIYRETIYVYNPCTRECVRLPTPISKKNKKSKSKLFHSLLFCGFGYNPLKNEYKVVLIRSIIGHQGIWQPGAEVCVYTLGSGKWRRTNKLESWRLNVSSVRSGVFFNGALHWIALDLINIGHYDIFSFDLANEEFRIIVPSPPMSTRYSDLSCVELGLWGGGCCLCVRQLNFVMKTTDIWVLVNNSKDKDKDIKSSWTMKFKIPSTTTDEENNKPRYYHHMTLLGRDKILLYYYYFYTNKGNGLVFVSYDSETGNFEDYVMDYYSELQSKWSSCDVIPYTKSFVSLKPFGEEDAGLPF